MPRKLSRAQRVLATLGGALCLAGVAPGAALAAECPVVPSTQAFAQFGDANRYYLAPGGAFETLTWTKVGAVDLSLDNDPFELAPGLRSVRLDDDASVSVTFCVDRTMPHLRFVAKGEGGMNVTVRTVYEGGTSVSSSSVSPYDHATWAPSRFVGLNTSWIPADEHGSATVTLRSSGTWRVDNVFVDPYRR